MADRVLDVRGKACPKPVIETRKVLVEDEPETLRVLVDNPASAENVSRMVRSLGRAVRIDREAAGEIELLITSGAPVGASGESPENAPASCPAPPRNVVLISSDRFGSGEEDLGRILMRAFVKTLHEVVPKPKTIFLVNSGVYLSVEGSDLVDDLRRLADSGVEVRSCGTCLDFYHLEGKLAVGAVTNMFEVVSALAAADRVLRP